jgi:serine/threonine-protein kinase
MEPGVRFCPHDGTPLTETSAVRTVPTPTRENPATKEIELPVTVGQRYRLEERRGGGGMAKVYRAIDITLEREVAVKLINPELRTDPEFDARFQREARIASQLADPHIVVVHDFGLDPTYGPFLVMEYLKGQSLRERLQTNGPLPLKAGLQLSAQLLLALIHAHGKNIVHRDIKPDNIFLLNVSGVRLHVRVLDFGIARIYRRDDTNRSETLTSPGAVLGTPRYMSPEQLAGQPVDARSDLYTAALVIHEALTGHLPYVSGKKFSELCPEASPALQELLDQCLKPNPNERPPSAVEVYLRLQELGKASGILLLPPGAMDRLVAARQSIEPTVAYQPAKAKGIPRRVWLVGAALLVAALLIGAVLSKLFLFHSSTPPRKETLLGVAIDDTQARVDATVPGLEKSTVMNPWAKEAAPAEIGHILHPEDLGLPEADLARLEVQHDSAKKVWALFHEGRLRALVALAPHPAYTIRGVKINGAAGDVLASYSEEQADSANVSVPGKTNEHIECRRYDPIGIGFELQHGKITGITLYPPRPAK